MALEDMIRKETPITIPMKCIDSLSHSDVFIEALIEKMHRHLALEQNLSEPEPTGRRTKRKTEYCVEKKMTSSLFTYYQRQNCYSKRLMILQWSGAALAVVTKKNEENLSFPKEQEVDKAMLSSLSFFLSNEPECSNSE